MADIVNTRPRAQVAIIRAGRIQELSGVLRHQLAMVLLPLGGIATIGWVAFLGWAAGKLFDLW